jgi:hypothetical protein
MWWDGLRVDLGHLPHAIPTADGTGPKGLFKPVRRRFVNLTSAHPELFEIFSTHPPLNASPPWRELTVFSPGSRLSHMP